MDIFEKLKGSGSLLAKYLSPLLFDQLKDKETSSGIKLNQIINSGLENLDSGIGVYAGDKDSYKTFAPLFDPIIKEYHGFNQDQVHISDLDLNKLDISNLDPNNEFIISTRIRVGRNLDGYALGTTISKEKRDEIELKVSNILNSFDDELKGKYYSLSKISNEDKQKLIEDHFLFKAGDRFLESAGLNRDWPSGRGIFHNNEKTFLVWINEEDHLRIISMEKGGDIKRVFTRLVKAINSIEKNLPFSYDKHLGYITSCPTNLGTALRASVHIKLPKLGSDMELFKSICEQYHVQIRGIDGEHSKSKSGIYDISNKRRLGISEIECIKDMYNGVKALISKEKEL